MSKIGIEDRFVGCLIGQCLGDAVGFIVEGRGPEVCAAHCEDVFAKGNIQDKGRGTYRFGQYSDDSQLARELIESFVTCRKFVPADYARRIASLFSENRVVGRGLATHAAALRLASGVHWRHAATPAPAAGNGTAMRAAPIGLLFFNDLGKLTRAAHIQSRIAHADPRCSAGSIAIAVAIALVLRGEDVREPKFARKISELVTRFDPVLAEALRELPRWVKVRPEIALTEICSIGLPPNHEDGWRAIG